MSDTINDCVDNYLGETLELSEITEPAAPASGKGVLFKKIGDCGLWWKCGDLTTAYDVSTNINEQIEATSLTTSTSTTYELIPSFSLTPVAGRYFIMFSATVRSSNNSSQVYVKLRIDGSEVNHTERRLEGNDWGTLAFQTIQNLDGTELVEVLRRTTGGTYRMRNRTLSLIRLGANE